MSLDVFLVGSATGPSPPDEAGVAWPGAMEGFGLLDASTIRKAPLNRTTFRAVLNPAGRPFQAGQDPVG